MILFTAGLLAGLYFSGLNVTGGQLGFFPGDLIDARFNNYILEHGYLYFTGQVPEYWNAPFMFPEQEVVSYSDNLLGTVPFYALFRLFGTDRETAFQLWYLLIVAFNYTAAFLFFKKLLRNDVAAVCGAMIFAFSIALQSQMGHAQTYPRFATPLAFLGLLYFFETQKPRHFFMALLAMVYQLYCGIYLGFLTAIPFALTLVYSFIFNRKTYWQQIKQRKWIISMALYVITAIILLLPLMIPYLRRAGQTGFYPYENISGSIPTFMSYFFSWKGSLLWDSFSETCIQYPAFWDHEIFTGGFASLGLITMLLVTVALLLWKRFAASLPKNHFNLFLITGFVTFFLFLRFGDVSLYRLIHMVPGYGSMRALQRIVNIELLFFAGAAAWLLGLVFKENKIWSYAAGFALIPLILLDNHVPSDFIHRREKTMSQQRINALIEKMKDIPKDAIVSYEPDSLESAPMDYQLDAMLATQSLGLKTLNGYTATSPDGYNTYWVNPGPESRRIWLETKKMTGMKVAVVH